MAGIKSLAAASDKWARRASVATSDYLNGVKNPRRGWSQAAQGAAASYQTGVTQAAQEGRYAKGVAAAGDEAWQQGATTKGPGRYTEGVAIAQPKWEQGFAPFQQAISSLQLPARGPRRSPQNLARVAAVVNAMAATAAKK